MHTYVIKKGSTDVSIELEIIDSTAGTPETGVVWNTAGIDLQYRRDGAVSTAITEATLASLTTAHTDGGFLHIGNGVYRFDLPDAAVASGVDKVVIHGTVTGMIVIPCVIQLVDYDPFDATRLGLTALPNAAADAAGGLPISDAGGLDLDTKLANTNEITVARMGALTDWINGGRLDLILDIIAADTTTDIPALIATAQADLDIITDSDGVVLGSAGVDLIWDEPISGHQTLGTTGRSQTLSSTILSETTAAGTPTTTTVDLTSGSAVDDFYNDMIIIPTSGALAGQARTITDYVGSTRTVTVDEPWTSALSATDGIFIKSTHVHPVTQIRAEIDSNSTQLAAILEDTSSIGITKNTAFNNLEFLMVDATDYSTPEVGLTVTGQMSIDGASFVSVNGTISEVSNGIYQIDLTAADTNGDVITYRFSATGAADTFVTVKTRA